MLLRAQPATSWMPAEPQAVVDAEYGDEAYRHVLLLKEELDATEDPEKKREIMASIQTLHELHVFMPGVRMLPDEPEAVAEVEVAQDSLFDDQGQEGTEASATSGAGVGAGPAPGALADEAHARGSDPWTSHAAARSLDPERLRETQKAVLSAFQEFGAMHHEALVEKYAATYAGRGWPKQSVSGLRTRTHELVEGGLLRDSGMAVVLASGRKSIVWSV